MRLRITQDLSQEDRPCKVPPGHRQGFLRRIYCKVCSRSSSPENYSLIPGLTCSGLYPSAARRQLIALHTCFQRCYSGRVGEQAVRQAAK
jgi:hypothetical protein